MDRLLAGVLVLVLAMVAVAIVPMIDGRRIAGSAVAAGFPPPPAPGDCVLPPYPQVAPAGDSEIEIPVTSLRFGSCRGEIAGQIVGLQRSDSSVVGPERPTTGVCFREIAAFAGLQLSGSAVTVPGTLARDPVGWMPTIGAIGHLVVPSTVAPTAGHEWAACLAIPILSQAFQGSLRNAYTTGSPPDQFGLCWAGTDLDEANDLLPCDQPHSAELLATGWIENRSDVLPAQIEASCHGLASRIMRTDDPSHNGTVTIVVDPVRRDGASRPDAPLAVNCFASVSGALMLSGTVIGLADRPVPLTG